MRKGPENEAPREKKAPAKSPTNITKLHMAIENGKKKNLPRGVGASPMNTPSSVFGMITRLVHALRA